MSAQEARLNYRASKGFGSGRSAVKLDELTPTERKLREDGMSAKPDGARRLRRPNDPVNRRLIERYVATRLAEFEATYKEG